MRTAGIRGVLTATMARCAAVGLLLLIFTPFTAPFATCELGPSAFAMTLEENAADSLAKMAATLALPRAAVDLHVTLVCDPSGRIAEHSLPDRAASPAPRPLRL